MNEKIVEFNKLLYREGALKLAIEAYQELVDIEIKCDSTYFYCEFENAVYDLEMTKHEFINYVIAMNEKSI